MPNKIQSFAVNVRDVQDVKACADRYGLSVSEVLRRCIYFGLVLVDSEQVAILKSRIGHMDSIDEVQNERRRITQGIRDRADAVLYEQMMED